jgi:hypothetical protein
MKYTKGEGVTRMHVLPDMTLLLLASSSNHNLFTGINTNIAAQLPVSLPLTVTVDIIN